MIVRLRRVLKTGEVRTRLFPLRRKEEGMPEDENMNKLRLEYTQARSRFLALYQEQLPVEPTLWRYLAPAPTTAKAMRHSLAIIKWRRGWRSCQ